MWDFYCQLDGLWFPLLSVWWVMIFANGRLPRMCECLGTTAVQQRFTHRTSHFWPHFKSEEWGNVGAHKHALTQALVPISIIWCIHTLLFFILWNLRIWMCSEEMPEQMSRLKHQLQCSLHHFVLPFLKFRKMDNRRTSHYIPRLTRTEEGIWTYSTLTVCWHHLQHSLVRTLTHIQSLKALNQDVCKCFLQTFVTAMFCQMHIDMRLYLCFLLPLRKHKCVEIGGW